MMRIDIGIEESVRKNITQGLTVLLADTMVIYFKTHQFHWNVTGPMFNTLHVMFEEQYTEMWTAIDAIAERIRSLGESVPGSMQQLIQLSHIKETADAPSAEDMIRALVLGHETLIKDARHLFDSVEVGKDEASADLVTQRLQIHEKTAWMLRSLLK